MARNGTGDNGEAELVEGVAQLNRALSIIATDLVDVGVALITANVQAGPQGSPTTNAALNTLHHAQDEIATMQRQMMTILEGVRVRAEAQA